MRAALITTRCCASPNPLNPRTVGGRPSVLARLSWIVLTLFLAGCHNHYILHPRHAMPAIEEWLETAEHDRLEMQFAWARPPGLGPFPTVLVHPEAWRDANKMRGILRGLASEGYLAAAVDYEREPEKGKPRSTFFVWRNRGDAGAAARHVLAHPYAEPDRLVLLGYSQGAMYSLLIAAYTDLPAAVVAYYPVGDVEAWLSDDTGRNWITRQAFKLVRRIFRKRSGAETDEEYHEMLRAGSPLYHVDKITAPVLLIHGDADTRIDIGESRRLAAALRSAGVDVTLLEIEKGEHVFNFRNLDQAEVAWEAMLDWLPQHLP